MTTTTASDQLEADVKLALDVIQGQARRVGRRLSNTEAKWIVIACFRKARGIGQREALTLTENVLGVIATAEETL